MSRRKFVDLTGRVLGRLRVVSLAGKNGSGNILWKCECSCGVVKEIASSPLLSGSVVSCGCLRQENKITHGKSKTREFRIWYGMIERCYNEKCCIYHLYGARGISVCDRWRYSFENFFEDMGERPSDKHTLERLDNDILYCKENCSWETMRVQSRNRRSNRWIEYAGLRMVIADWDAHLGLKHGSVSSRINRGWTEIEAVSFPRGTKKKDIR